MGIFYNSFCFRGDRSEDVRASLRRWLHGRGFELSTQPMLFDLEGEAERSAFLVTDRRWTVLVFSKYEEEGRLLRELRTWASPFLYVWVQDSDVWGYDVIGDEGFAASFSSDPRSYRSFQDEAAERPEADPEDVRRLLGDVTGPAAELRRIHRRRRVFAEDVCLEFCRWLGSEAAASSYDDLERGAVGNVDWTTEQLLFYHPDSVAEPAVGTDLHAVDLSDLGVFSVLHPQSELTPELRAEVEQMRRRAQLRLAFLKPVAWIARGWGWTRDRRSPRPGRSWAEEPAAVEGDASATDGSTRTNERHHCQVTLPRGVRSKPVSGRPAAVFAFEVGGTPVTCTARRLWKIADVLRPPSRSEVVRDEKYLTESGLKARHLLFKLPPRYTAHTDDPSFLGLHVVETRVALYVFLYRFLREVRPDVEDAVRLTAVSFRQLEGASALLSPSFVEAASES